MSRREASARYNRRVCSRAGSFILGFAVGALTVAAFRRLREYVESEDYEHLAESVQENLQELEARLLGEEPPKKGSRKRAAASRG